MKPHFPTSPSFQVLVRTLLAVVATLALSTAHTFANVVNATYTTGREVPVASNGFSGAGKSVNLTLNFAPKPGTQLMVVRNTGADLHQGGL